MADTKARTVELFDASLRDGMQQPNIEISAPNAVGFLQRMAAFGVQYAEIGIDMSHFQTAAHLISWAGLCPKNDESAGKRRSNRMKEGAPWLKTTLIQCVWVATRTKGSYLQAQRLAWGAWRDRASKSKA